MKSQLLLSLALITAILSLGTIPAQAEDKVFTESGEIVDGDVWVLVDIYNDDTIVDMSGGMCDFITTHDKSTLNIIGGQAQVGAQDFSIINISSGSLSGAHAYNNGKVNFSGNAISLRLAAVDYGIANMTGGVVEYLAAGDSGTLNIYSGVVTDSLYASGNSIVNVFGHDFYYDPSGGMSDGGQLTGFWLDDTSLSIDLYGVNTYSHINLIPEPSMLLLLGLGSVVIRRKK